MDDLTSPSYRLERTKPNKSTSLTSDKQNAIQRLWRRTSVGNQDNTLPLFRRRRSSLVYNEEVRWNRPDYRRNPTAVISDEYAQCSSLEIKANRKPLFFEDSNLDTSGPEVYITDNFSVRSIRSYSTQTLDSSDFLPRKIAKKHHRPHGRNIDDSQRLRVQVRDIDSHFPSDDRARGSPNCDRLDSTPSHFIPPLDLWHVKHTDSSSISHQSLENRCKNESYHDPLITVLFPSVKNDPGGSCATLFRYSDTSTHSIDFSSHKNRSDTIRNTNSQDSGKYNLPVKPLSSQLDTGIRLRFQSSTSSRTEQNKADDIFDFGSTSPLISLIEGDAKSTDDIEIFKTCPSSHGFCRRIFSDVGSLLRGRPTGVVLFLCRATMVTCGLGNATTWPMYSTHHGFIPWTISYFTMMLLMLFPMTYLEFMLYHIVRGNLGVVVENLNSKMSQVFTWLSLIVPITFILSYGLPVCRATWYSIVYSFTYAGDRPSFDDLICEAIETGVDCVQFHRGLDILNSLDYPCSIVQDFKTSESQCQTKMFSDSIEDIQSIDGLFMNYPDPTSNVPMQFKVSPIMFGGMFCLVLFTTFSAAHGEAALKFFSHHWLVITVVFTMIVNFLLICVEIASKVSPSVLWDKFTYNCTFTKFLDAQMWADSALTGIYSLQSVGGVNALLVRHLSPSASIRDIGLAYVLGDAVVCLGYGIFITFLYAYAFEHYNVLDREDIEQPPLTQGEVVFSQTLNPGVDYNSIVRTFGNNQVIYTLVPSIINELSANRPILQAIMNFTYYAPLTLLSFVSLQANSITISELICKSRLLTDYISWATKNNVAVVIFAIQIPHIVFMTSSWGETLLALQTYASDLWQLAFVYLLFMFLMFSFNLMRVKELFNDRGHTWLYPTWFSSITLCPIIIALYFAIFVDDSSDTITKTNIVTTASIALLVVLHVLVLIGYLYLTEKTDVAWSAAREITYHNIYSVVIRYQFTVHTARIRELRLKNTDFEDPGFPLSEVYFYGSIIWAFFLRSFFPAVIASAFAYQVKGFASDIRLVLELPALPNILAQLSLFASVIFLCCMILAIMMKTMCGKDLTKYLCRKTKEVKQLRRLTRVDKKEPELISRFLAVIPHSAFKEDYHAKLI